MDANMGLVSDRRDRRLFGSVTFGDAATVGHVRLRFAHALAVHATVKELGRLHLCGSSSFRACVSISWRMASTSGCLPVTSASAVVLATWIIPSLSSWSLAR